MWAVIGWIALGVVIGGGGVVLFFRWLFRDFDNTPFIRF